MKNIYVGKTLTGKYLYSESDLWNPSCRLSFEKENELWVYLASDDMKKIRNRKNLVVLSSLDDNLDLEEKLSKIGFRSPIVKDL